MREAPLVPFEPRFATEPAAVLAEAFARHGPVFRVLVGSRVLHILIGPEANRFLLNTGRSHFSNAEGWQRLQRAPEVFGRGLTFNDGEEHDRHRKAMNPAFRMDRARSVAPVVARVTEAESTGWDTREQVELFEAFYRITFFVAAEAFLGLRDRVQIEELVGLYRELEALATTTHTMSERLQIEAPRTQRIREILQPLIDRSRANPGEDALGRLTGARDKTGFILTNEELQAEANQLLLAGHFNTSSLATWLFYLLLKNPEYLRQLDDDEVFERVLMEAERLYPPLAVLPRVALEDVEFAGCTIPRDSFVLCSVLGGHHIPQVFPDPARFDPERFGPDRREHVRTPYALIGFSSGPRVCLGIHVAKEEIKTVARTIFRRYRLELIAERPVTCRYVPQAIPVGGVWVRARPQHSDAPVHL